MLNKTFEKEICKVTIDPIYSIQTARLYIRQTFKNDLDNFISLYGDEKVMEKYTDGNIRNPERIKIMIDINIKRWEEKNPYSSMSIFDKETNEFMGNIFISSFERSDNTGLLGFLFHQKFWNKGFAKEAAFALTNVFIPYITSVSNIETINEIIAYARPDNLASNKILQFCGFELSEVVEKFGAERFKYSLTLERLKNIRCNREQNTLCI
ncbi:GNAT family N-acetyltransferase [Candidatus Jidaibacter acanthamoebae]|nr:GNAT family N-acetyltransferase [Candidatus Jidaibacter acanthamoeba]